MGSEPPSLGACMVLYRQRPADVRRLVEATGAMVRHARRSGALGPVHVGLGDCSPEPVFGTEEVDELAEAAAEGGLDGFAYEWFGDNLGAGGGVNRLALARSDDFVLVLHPDTYPAPTALVRLLRPFVDPTVGAADARQLPVEHPKDFDPATGDTSWVGGSFLLVRGELFRALGGFDADHFFLCGADVDLSWRVRLEGLRTVHEPAAVVFRDERIEADATVAVPPAREYHATLAHLLLAHRYGRPDLVAATVEALATAGTDGERAATAEWRARLDAGSLPEVVAGGGRVAQFVDGHPARHRF